MSNVLLSPPVRHWHVTACVREKTGALPAADVKLAFVSTEATREATQHPPFERRVVLACWSDIPFVIHFWFNHRRAPTRGACVDLAGPAVQMSEESPSGDDTIKP